MFRIRIITTATTTFMDDPDGGTWCFREVINATNIASQLTSRSFSIQTTTVQLQPPPPYCTQPHSRPVSLMSCFLPTFVTTKPRVGRLVPAIPRNSLPATRIRLWFVSIAVPAVMNSTSISGNPNTILITDRCIAIPIHSRAARRVVPDDTAGVKNVVY